jgi:hypothetical protein
VKEINIVKIELLPSGEVVIEPDASDTGLFEYIYRAAAGVHWNKDRKAFVTRHQNHFRMVNGSKSLGTRSLPNWV